MLYCSRSILVKQNDNRRDQVLTRLTKFTMRGVSKNLSVYYVHDIAWN